MREFSRAWWLDRWRLATALIVMGFIVVSLAAIWLAKPKKLIGRTLETHYIFTVALRQRAKILASGWGYPDSTKGTYNEPVFDVNCRRKYYGEKQCHPHRCNRRFETTQCTIPGGICTDEVWDTCWEQCPEYKNWCEYSYYDWPIIEQAGVTGYGLLSSEARWPDLHPVGPLQRAEYGTQFVVKLSVTGGEDVVYRTKSLLDYQRFAPGTVWCVNISGLTGNVVVSEQIQAEKD